MNDASRTVQRTYLVLTLLTTLAASFIWGINTLFLLDAGLEQRRGVRRERVLHGRPGALRGPDRRRRRHARPAVLVHARRGDAAGLDAPLPRHVAGPRAAAGLGDRVDPARARVHVLLGRDRGVARRRAARRPASRATSRRSSGGPRSIGGVAMLVGSVSGGVIAQATNLGVPYLAAGGDARRHARRRLPLHARPRVQAAARSRARSRRSGPSSAAPSTAASATRRSAG